MRVLLALAAGLMVGAVDPAPDLGEVVQDQVIPPGSRWVCTSRFGNGSVDEFKGGEWQTCNPPGVQVLVAEYALNQKTFPPRIDLKHGKVRRYGIYRVEGNRLLVCLGVWKGTNRLIDRPTTFAHRPERGQYLFVYKRLK